MKKFNGNAVALAVMSLVATVSAHSAVAAGVVGTGGTQVNTAGAAPVVNINGANAQGVSRNTFSQFDVDSNGVVFNNLTADGASRLAGKLLANDNLNGTAARVIVADIASAQASKLNGAMEVAGAPAHLLIANAAGISCNGCSTINAPVVTLAAARFAPRDDSPLALEVDTTRTTPALLEIGSEGADVGAGQLNLLSRATRINGIVKGWTINSHTGTTFEGDEHGNFKGKLTRDVENAPAVALDVSELGGMYANKILLEGSEYGLGVNNAGVIMAGKGGMGEELFGSNVTMTGQAMMGSEGYAYRTNSIANRPDAERSEDLQGKTDEQAFERVREENRATNAAITAQNGADAMNAWSDADKTAATSQLLQQTTEMRARVNAEVQAFKDRVALEAKKRAEYEAAEAAKRAEWDALQQFDENARMAAEEQAGQADQAQRNAEIEANNVVKSSANYAWQQPSAQPVNVRYMY